MKCNVCNNYIDGKNYTRCFGKCKKIICLNCAIEYKCIDCYVEVKDIKFLIGDYFITPTSMD